MRPRGPFIAVIGDRDPPVETCQLAEEVGRRLAEAGAVVVCGGLGGVMEAACRGAKLAGGLTVGILPGEDPTAANPYVDVPVVTGLGTARNALVVKTAGAVIAIAGGFGTLSEIAYALNHEIPVIGLDTWQIRAGCAPADPIVRAGSPAEAVEQALARRVSRPRPTSRE
ncbi:MAG TPA: TIGR00725 family protein [Dehalococcoidia bacterium]|nr:TIGR00725 family protein [Dehalococcoidia bacterium]